MNINVRRTFAVMPLLVGLAGGVTTSAWAGADDGGVKAFFAVPGPGAADLGPGPTAARVPAAQSTDGISLRGRGATATVNEGAYETYRHPYHHRTRHSGQPQ